MIKDYFSLAFKNLGKRKLRSWLTMIGIFIGIAAVVSLIGLGEGLRTAITSQFGFLGTDVLSVRAAGIDYAGPPGTGSAKPLTDDLADKIAKVNGVETAINRHVETLKIEFNNRQIIGYATSIPEGDNRKLVETVANLKAEQGRLLKDGDTTKVVLGNDFTKDSTFGKAMAIGDKVLINGESYEVVGILQKKGSFIFDGAVYINEKIFLDKFRQGDNTVNIIAVKVKDEKEIDNIKNDIEKLLRKERNVEEGEEDFIVESPQSVLSTLNSAIFAVQLFVYIIASISIIVGGIGITNTMYTSVLERTNEIGIMKAIGAKNSTIFTLFFIESGFLGMLGGLIGIILGAGLAYGLAFIGQLFLGSELIRAQVSLLLIFGSLSFSFLVGLIAGLIPAYQASKKNPVDALRFVK